MKEKINWKVNTLPHNKEEIDLEFLSEKEISKVRDFHASFPQYK